MGIKITGATIQSEIMFDQVFIESLEMTQVRDRDDLKEAVYRMDVKYRLYGVDIDGLRHYKSTVHSIVISDYIAKANGKVKQLGLLGAIEDALADLLTESDAIDTATVV